MRLCNKALVATTALTTSKTSSTFVPAVVRRMPTTTRRMTLSARGGAAKRAKTNEKAEEAASTAASTVESSSSSATNNTETEPWFSVFTKGDAQYNKYMSDEWGFERRGDVKLFEKLSLEGAQSGLSWLTILRKREAYRKTFHQFDPVRVASMTEADVERIIATEAESPEQMVVRHRGKIQSVMNNAKCILQMRQEACQSEDQDGVLDEFLWSFVNDKPILRRRAFSEMPCKTAESEAMSKALKKRGFRFVGPTTCYSMMQSVGMVIDHPVDSPEWKAAYERLKSRPGGFQEEGEQE